MQILPGSQQELATEHWLKGLIMEYAQLNETATEATQINTQGPVEWDDNNFCSAEALVKDGRADLFRVVPLVEVDPPPFDPQLQKCYRDGCEKIDGIWHFKWTVLQLTPEELDAQRKLKVPKQVSPRQIRQALNRASLRSQVELAVASGDQDIKDWWEFSTQVERNHPMVIAMAEALSITELELDDLFTLAGTL